MDKLPRESGFPFRFGKILPSQFYTLPVAGNKIRSPVYLESLRDSVLAYDKPDFRCPDPVALKTAYLIVKRKFRLPQYARLIPLTTVLDGTSETSSMYTRSPCLPWITYGFKTKQDVYQDPESRASIIHFVDQVQRGEDIKPADVACFARSHLYDPSDSEPKVRATWGFSATVIALEAMFAMPLIDLWKSYVGPWAYGYETARGGHRKISTERPAGIIHTSDFSHFDSSVSKELINYAFDILEEYIDFTSLPDVSAVRLVNQWTWIRRNFCVCTIRLPNGERFRKHTGVPSGSYFTNLIDTIVNAIVMNYIFMDSRISILYEKYLGDDSFIVADGRLSQEALTESASRCGFEINLVKSKISGVLTDHQFLGFGFTDDGMPIKPKEYWYDALRCPEREDETIDDYRSRALGLLYAANGIDFEMHAILSREARGVSNIVVGRGLSRMLEHLGVRAIEPEPPPAMQLFLQTQY